MTYPIIPELYGIVARKLLDEIGEKSFYSGSFSFDYGSKECRFVASIVIYRSKECLPEGDADRIDDLVPVWWEFHTSDQAGERPNDFSFPSLRSTSSDSTPQDRTSHPERRLLRSFPNTLFLVFDTRCNGRFRFPLSFEKLNAVLRLSDAAILESGRPVRIETLRLPSAAPCHRAELKNY